MVGQLQDPVFWELFWDNGGRFLLTLIVAIYTLLTGIMIYGHIKNHRKRSKVSGSNRRWINQTTKRRRLFDGMEVLEVNTERLSARFDMQGARPTNTDTGVLVPYGHDLAGIDRVIYHPLDGTIEPIRRSKDKLPTSTEREESFSYSPSKVLVK